MTFEVAPTWVKDLLCVGLWVSSVKSLTINGMHRFVIGIHFVDSFEAQRKAPLEVRRYYEDNFM